MPYVTVILGVFLVFWSFIAGRTRFGRHVYAVGGSAEAARRAGINVDRVRIAVFMISGFMAGVGGIMLASRLRSVATGTGGGNLLLLVIAAAVIGGTSLFGGVGRVVSALLGALVIASIQNGMDLLGLASGTKFVITGLVLLSAVLVDALLQAPPGRTRRRVTTGETIGVGMLGYAFMGKAHTRAFREADAFHAPLAPQLVSLSGRTADKVEAAREELGWAEAVTDWREQVADERIGLFDNGGPNALHAEPTIAAARNGKHVLCEKPLGRTADESLEIWREAERAGVVHMCGFNYRFVPAVRLAREMLEAGDLGDLFHFRARYLQSWGVDAPPSWRFDREAAGSGALGDLGAHIVDIGRYLVGEPVAVTALVKTFIEGHEVDDTFAATVEFENGVVGTLEASQARAGPDQPRTPSRSTARAARSPSTSSA